MVMLLETGLIGEFWEDCENGRRGVRYEGDQGENARSKSQVKGVSRKANARRINSPGRYERRFFEWLSK
jgi:hypothetical protein